MEFVKKIEVEHFPVKCTTNKIFALGFLIADFFYLNEKLGGSRITRNMRILII